MVHLRLSAHLAYVGLKLAGPLGGVVRFSPLLQLVASQHRNGIDDASPMEPMPNGID